MRLINLSFVVLFLSLFSGPVHAGFSGAQAKLLEYCHSHYDPKGLIDPVRDSSLTPMEVCNCIAGPKYSVLLSHKASQIKGPLNNLVRQRSKEKDAIEALKVEISEGGKNVTEKLFVKACKPYAKMEENIQVNGLSAQDTQADFEAMREDLNMLMVKHDAVAYPLDVYCRRKARFDYSEADHLSQTARFKATLSEIENQSFDVTGDEWLIGNVYGALFKRRDLLLHCTFN
tara:strand:- start:560639 stop:561328 length:690 start_codon:yes stop_codon:yes gene_type:complete